MRYTAVDREILVDAKNAIRAIVLDMNDRYYGFPGFHACARDLFRLMRTNPHITPESILVTMVPDVEELTENLWMAWLAMRVDVDDINDLFGDVTDAEEELFFLCLLRVVASSVLHCDAVRNEGDIADELELARGRASATSNGVEHAMNTILDDGWRSDHDTEDCLTATTEAIDAMTRQDSSWRMRVDRAIVHTASELLASSSAPGDTDPVVSPEASWGDLDTMAARARDSIEQQDIPDMADEDKEPSTVALEALAPIETLLLFMEASNHAQRRTDDMDRVARAIDTQVTCFEHRLGDI